MVLFRCIAACLAVCVGCSAFAGEAEGALGRPVRVVSIGLRSGISLDTVCALVAQEGAKGADLIVLPETLRGDPKPLEAEEGQVLSRMAPLAREYGMYIVCPIYRMHEGKRLNTAFLLDRTGQGVGEYNKVFPYWSEFDLEPPASVGESAPVFATDFGKLGIAICFDANFPEVWQSLADQGAELVVWPSAYSAGTQLQAHALNYHFYIVTATLIPDCLVYDITGERLLYEKGEKTNVSRITLDLDRGIYHQNFNMEGRKKVLKEHADEVKEDRWLEQEQWFVLKAIKPGVSARALAKSYGMEELRDYKNRSRREIDRMRGWSFRERAAESAPGEQR
ncbi:MAG TPA: carbon-nitrogen hydrolase family protein [Candidatus Bathyarchaeia archaeon]|nr:carbon-nitrogen hydrolase family protein [Candidatus Bathyarchaeia archaeon]